MWLSFKETSEFIADYCFVEYPIYFSVVFSKIPNEITKIRSWVPPKDNSSRTGRADVQMVVGGGANFSLPSNNFNS